MHVPDLSSLCESESHVVLLFDSSHHATSYLALGCNRELVYDSPESGILEALEAFTKKGKSWTFGWLGYDLKNEIERLETRAPSPLAHPVLAWWEPEIVIKFSYSGYEVIQGDPNDPRTLEALSSLESQERKNVYPEGGNENEMVWSWKKDEYLKAFHEVKSLIKNGDVYELNLCMPLKGRAPSSSSWPLFTRLESLTRAPFSAYLQCGPHRIMSGSPERFLKKTGSRLLSQPIKGTIRRGLTSEEDLSLARELQSSEKERAENVMIVDLVRNDLSRVAQKATVEVTELCAIHSFSTVHQMVSSIQCQLAPDKGLASILHATFPMGSMTGAPKIAAMKHIDRLELEGRGSYSGSAGYIDPSGDFDLNVLIRSLFHNVSQEGINVSQEGINETNLVSNVGGAITSLSDGELEYQECLLKAESVIKAVV
ncbi:MAG: aminodeoxychorismate synthase component I [Bacteroidetes bacterium]|nr:MAG: aminodeoxychorismate synthase component I [Bacteroidota bacterium]